MIDPLLDADDLPEEWGVRRLKFLARLNVAKLPDSTPENEEIRYLNISAVHGDGSRDEPEVMPFGDAPARARRLAEAGDTAISTVRTYLKAITYVDEAASDCVWSTGFALVSPGPELASRFLFYVMRAGFFVDEVVSRSVGVSYPAIRPEEIGDILCPVPPLAIQTEVADFLDHHTAPLRQLRGTRTEQIALLRDRLQLLRRAAVADLPRTAKLAYEVAWLSGGTPPKDDAVNWSGAFPWASSKDLGADHLADTVDHITEDAAAEHSKTAPTGALLVSTRGMSLAKRVPLGLCERPMAFNQDLKALVPGRRLDGEFLRIVLRGYERELLALVVEAAHGTRRLQTKDLKAFRIPLPDLDEQAAIVARVMEIENTHQDAIQELERLNKMLLERELALTTRAVTGQMDVASYGARRTARAA